ncbi:hypothetical protein AALA79_04410 [Lachnospiraceae bacterium 64-25]
MGHGSYQSKDWEKLRSFRKINSQSTVQDMYQSRSMKDYLNPYGVKYRESCDSMDNPASTAIIFGLDVTGSMGYLSEAIPKAIRRLCRSHSLRRISALRNSSWMYTLRQRRRHLPVLTILL